MKTIKIPALLFYLFLIFDNCAAKSLQARLAFATFYAAETGPYVETYLSVSGQSVAYKLTSAKKFEASIEVSIVFSEDNQIKYFDKYNLLSPEIDDTIKSDFNFLDQHRFSLANGKYKFELIIKDNNGLDKPYKVTQDVVISYHPNIMAISDIELLERFETSTQEKKISKGGYDLIPLVDNFYPSEKTTLKYYAEVYNSNAVLGNDGYVISQHIETYENHRVLENFKKLNRQQSKPVTALLREIDITDLPSGNYNLVIEVRNRNNELLASRELFFQRSKVVPLSESSLEQDLTNTFVGAYTNKDSLKEYIRSLEPIAGPAEMTFTLNQLDAANVKALQSYLYTFWTKRDANNASQIWQQYKTEVDKVNANYSTRIKRGYVTERGRVYLKYGPPNQISVNENEPSAYPYEIWHYYTLKNQSNRKFVFYNPDMVTNDYELIHSDALGEISDPQWKLKVYSRTEPKNNLDEQRTKDHFGKKSDDIFRNPR